MDELSPGEALVREVFRVISSSWTVTGKQRRWGCPAVFRLVESLEAALFLIGVQEAGKGVEKPVTKEEKQALIMEGTCAGLS